MIIRPETSADHDEIRRVVRAAFGSDAEPALVERIRASVEYRPELALVAEQAGRVAGHVMISGATLRSTDGDHPIVMLSPLAVDPEVQRSGIGGALVREAARLAEQAGHRFVVLEGSPTYYCRFGFEPAARYGVTMPLPHWAPAEAAQLLPLRGCSAADLHDGGHVVYPPAFDAME